MVEKNIAIIFFSLFLLIFICIISIMYYEYKTDLRRTTEEFDGIEDRYVVTGFYFLIYIEHENEKYYLNKDGNFYTSEVNAEEYFFKSKEEQIEYIKLHKNEIKEKYPGAKIDTYKITKYIGRCKKLEVV